MTFNSLPLPPLFAILLVLQFHPAYPSPQAFMSFTKALSDSHKLFSLPQLPIRLPEDSKESGSSSDSDAPTRVHLKRKHGHSKDYNKQKKQKVEIEEEEECKQMMFMSPFHLPVQFSQNDSIYSRVDKSCTWKFIGSEPCIPMITCDTTNLTRTCEEEYLEIVDGAEGYMKICGGDLQQVTNISATDGLRDLYVMFKVLKGAKEKRNLLFNCTVICSKRMEGTPLEKGFQSKTNPKCYCGTKPNDDRIAGGVVAKKFEFPWLVALVETNTRQPFCGGSIINDRFILTAAHCFKGRFIDYRNVQVVVNGHEFDVSPRSFGGTRISPRTYSIRQLEKMDRMNGSRRYNVEEIIIHPLYVIETNDFDIALLKLQEDIDLSPKPRSLMNSLNNNMDTYLQQPRAVCLPELGSYLRTFSNQKATVAGWGLPGADANGTTQVLQKLEVKVFSPQVCKDLYAHRVNRRMLCAGHREGGKDSCSGDSGGPLILEERTKTWYQIGLVSWGEGCGQIDNVGVYFRLTEGVQWIHYNSNYNGARDENGIGEDMSATWCMTPP